MSLTASVSNLPSTGSKYDSCTICFGEFDQNNLRNFHIKPAENQKSHQACQKCFNTWVRQKPTCPTCRIPLDPKQIPSNNRQPLPSNNRQPSSFVVQHIVSGVFFESPRPATQRRRGLIEENPVSRITRALHNNLPNLAIDLLEQSQHLQSEDIRQLLITATQKRYDLVLKKLLEKIINPDLTIKDGLNIALSFAIEHNRSSSIELLRWSMDAMDSTQLERLCFASIKSKCQETINFVLETTALVYPLIELQELKNRLLVEAASYGNSHFVDMLFWSPTNPASEVARAYSQESMKNAFLAAIRNGHYSIARKIKAKLQLNLKRLEKFALVCQAPKAFFTIIRG